MSLEMINQLLMLIRSYEAALIREGGLDSWKDEDENMIKARISYINGVSDMANELVAFFGERIKEIIEIEKEEEIEYRLKELGKGNKKIN